MEDPTVKGNEAPLVSATRRTPARSTPCRSAGWTSVFRLDYRYTGPHLVGAVQRHLARPDRSRWTGASRSAANAGARRCGAKNLTDEEYNQEFSPGGFLFKALPIRYGIEFDYSF